MKNTIVVTGAAGFIGSRFARSCNDLGIDIVSVDEPRYFETRAEHGDIDFGHVESPAGLLPLLERGGRPPRAIVHLGACSDTTETDREYLDEVNTRYSQKLWLYAAENGVPFVYASSAATYGDGGNGYDDDESLIPALRPLNLYGESKQAFDLWALSQEKIGVAPPQWSGFKFFNVYGFGERHKGRMASVALHVYDRIASSAEALLFKSYLKDVADGEQKRDFVYVEDAVNAMHFALEHPIPRGIYNLGTGEARTFLDLALAVFRAAGREAKVRYIDMPEDLRGRYQYFTEAKMEKLRAAGYSARFTSLEDGVACYVSELKASEKVAR